jgi:hypothetical protein
MIKGKGKIKNKMRRINKMSNVKTQSSNQCQKPNFKDFIETAPENPVLWTGMKGASAKGGKNN